MPREFYSATAEQVIAAVDAVAATGRAVSAQFVARFADMPEASAHAALDLAVDLNLLSREDAGYSLASPLCRFIQSPKPAVRAAVMRAILESYEPFRIFRSRLLATSDSAQAAAQTKVILNLDAHRDEISTTLVGLGTFAQALVSEGGGHHSPSEIPMDSQLARLAGAAEDLAAAEQHVRRRLDNEIADGLSYAEILMPLSQAVLQSGTGSVEGAENAIQQAGNAIESYLIELAARENISLGNATGIVGKIDKFAGQGWLPSKLQGIGRYLGQLRNAADHGVDPDLGASWSVRPLAGAEFVSVSLSFISACELKRRDGQYVI